MMLKKLFFCIFISILFSFHFPTLFAQEETKPKVAEIFLGSGVENREAIGVDTIFSADAGKIYCWTKITGATTETQISHNWYYQDEEVIKIEMPVKSSSYRCWSIKTIYPEMTGSWKVEIEDAEGEIIGAISFVVN